MNTITSLLCGTVWVLLGSAAVAQDTTAPMAGMDHGNMEAYGAAMDDMMAAMDSTEMTGDAQVDYLLMMIPHHQSAVDMSEALLPEVTDPEIKALAEEVIAAQEDEIAQMKAMLARLGHPVE